jgi:hypothetical protein
LRAILSVTFSVFRSWQVDQSTTTEGYCVVADDGSKRTTVSKLFNTEAEAKKEADRLGTPESHS